MFNPDAATKTLGPCVFTVEELDLDATLAGVMFNGELQVEIDSEGDWYIYTATATNTKGVTQVYPFRHPIYQAVVTTVLADERLCDLIFDACVEHGE